MYDGWRKNAAHLREWVDKTNKFIEHAFSQQVSYKHWNREVSMQQVSKWFIPQQEKGFNTHL
jgi:hypothetical protein